MNTAAEVAIKLLQINAIKLSPQSPFTWASGIQSPIYCDNRIVLSYPEARNFIKSCLAEKAPNLGPFDAIAGVATAGIAHGMLLADALGLPFGYVRSNAKKHGRQNLIEGNLEGYQRILVVEDLISTGGSSLQAVEALRAAGHEVTGVLAIFSYGLPQAVTAFRAANCNYDSLSDYDVLIQEAHRLQYVTDDQLKILTNWRTSIQLN
jgi:orotate phosphoribosyltransferase